MDIMYYLGPLIGACGTGVLIALIIFTVQAIKHGFFKFFD